MVSAAPILTSFMKHLDPEENPLLAYITPPQADREGPVTTHSCPSRACSLTKKRREEISLTTTIVS